MTVKELDDMCEELKYYQEHPIMQDSAKDMFKKLGYEYSNNGTQICYFNDYEYEYIWFYLETKTIEVQFNISLELLQAINKQVEELGWN